MGKRGTQGVELSLHSQNIKLLPVSLNVTQVAPHENRFMSQS